MQKTINILNYIIVDSQKNLGFDPGAAYSRGFTFSWAWRIATWISRAGIHEILNPTKITNHNYTGGTTNFRVRLLQ